MREQILDRDLTLRGHRVELRRRRRSACGACAAPTRRRLQDRDLHVAELGDIARHRVVQAQLPFLDHHHHADADDRLGHRGDAKHVRGRHRLLAVTVGHALSVHIRDAPLARDGDDSAGEIARGDAALNHLGDALQPLGGETDFLRLANSSCRADRQGEEYEDRDTDDGGSHHSLPEKDGRIIDVVSGFSRTLRMSARCRG